MLRYLSLLGFVFFPAYYFLRFSKSTPVYDDWWLRMVDAAICLVLFLRDRWPEKLRRFYFPYSYAVVIITLPVTFVFTSLMNDGGTVAVGNTLMAAFLVILLSDWRNTAVILVSGFAVGTVLYVAIDPTPGIPRDYVARFPILLATVVGGSLFKAALEQATAERVRSAYAALAGSIAHEMRNPLAQIKGSLVSIEEILPLSTHGKTPSISHDDVRTLRRQVVEGELAVRRGLQVISMTLDDVNLKPADPSKFAFLSAADVCASAVQDYSFETVEQRKRVVLNVVKDFTFRGDETAYMFVLFNLIKNSLYYLGPYPESFLTITVGGNEIRVRDNGPGIEAEQIPHLFDPFRSAGKSGGTGLGLSYCRRVMRSFGGEITCASVRGEFTEFTMRFPPVDETELEEHRRQTIAQVRTALAGKRILIVEDDPVQRMATRQKLGLLALTAELAEAEDGETALQLLGAQRFDIVLLDLRMPGIDGYGVADRVRREPGFNREVRILAYSSEPAHLAREKVLRRGMDGFVSKPCAQLPLLAALQAVVQDRRLRVIGNLENRRILIADDSTFSRKAVAMYLRSAGATVIEADHGQAVMDHLHRSGHFDAVILDFHMPGMDGLEATKLIRSSETQWASVPIIAVTARSDESAVTAARAAGMNGFLVKPVDQSLLYEELGKLVGERTGPVRSSTTAVAPQMDATLLDLPRLENYKKLGMLSELVTEYVPEMTRLIARLSESVERSDRDAALNALHTLLGMSGEAGVQALYRKVRQVYVPLLEHEKWPAEGWLSDLRLLADRSQEALQAYCAAQADTSSASGQVPGSRL
jgi:CheY-like chemotaxis protein